jgi:GST-like protein
MAAEHVLYGYPGSGSAAIEAALALAGLSCRIVNAASWDAGSELAQLRQANGLLQIPALRWPDGRTMSESAAILVELGLRHPDSGLLPADPAERAQSIRGLVYVAANCYSAIGVLDYPERYTSAAGEAAKEQIREGTRRRLHEMWSAFADAFPPHPFLAGERLGALDLLATVVSKWAGTRPHLKAERPALAAHFEKVEQVPPVKAVFDRHWPPKGA